MQTQRVCLAMIVRNEAHVIRRCLESVKGLISHYAIVDTGSTDGTQALIRDVLRDIPGSVTDRPWTDFATARNQSLAAARREFLSENGNVHGYALVIDADEELVKTDPGAKWGPFEADSYAIRLRMANTEAVWCRRQLFKLSCDWHYEDEIHERSVSSDAETAGNIFGFEIVSYNDSARNKDGLKAKAKRDAKTLRRMLKAKPDDPRLTYYLAQTLMNAGDIEGAIELHKKRLTLGGFGEELYASAIHIAALHEMRGDHWEDVVQDYLRAYEVRPTRAEPLWAVAALYNDRNHPALAELYARAACRLPRPVDSLVVTESVYRYGAADELAGALTRLGRYEEAKRILDRIVALPDLPDHDRERAKGNLASVEACIAAEAA
jgi:glycosyltransferase involved in cell wall biosynthesis